MVRFMSRVREYTVCTVYSPRTSSANFNMLHCYLLDVYSMPLA